MIRESKIVAVDLFCGAGGLTRGLAESGIVVAGGIDSDESCQHAYEHNNSGSKFIASDVSQVTGVELETLWGKAKIRLLAGCAPCQPFSTYSQSKPAEEDNRYPLLLEFSRLIKETKPELITMENVPNVLKKPVFCGFVRSLRAQGYKVSYCVVKCEDYGIPQRRRRLVLLASSIGPAPELDLPNQISENTVRGAIHGLPKLQAGDQCTIDKLHRCASLREINLKRIRKSLPGGTWKDWPDEIRLKCHQKESGSGYTPVYGRLSWDHAAPTITTQCYNYGSGRFGHPAQDRPISLREAALLQSFPHDYEFDPPGRTMPIRDVARLIGNAVPVTLGMQIGKSFVRCSKQNHARRT